MFIKHLPHYFLNTNLINLIRFCVAISMFTYKKVNLNKMVQTKHERKSFAYNSILCLLYLFTSN